MILRSRHFSAIFSLIEIQRKILLVLRSLYLDEQQLAECIPLAYRVGPVNTEQSL